MIKIIEYLPQVLRQLLELEYITDTEDIELRNIQTGMVGLTKEVIVATATESGIERWEKLFRITPSVSDSLELRRFRIESILLNKLPYTIRWLYKRLDEIIGPGNYTVDMNYSEYTLTITVANLPLDMLSEVQRQFRNAIPANIVLLIGNAPGTESSIHVGVGLRYSTHYIFPILE